jgi:hypothetical protein
MNEVVMSVVGAARRKLSAFLLAGSLVPAFGHDTFQTTVVGKLNEAGLEVRITLSAFGAGNLLQQAGVTIPGGVASSFEEQHPKLIELAGKMIAVSAGDADLSLANAVVAPGEEGDVEFRLTYPRPADRDLQLHVAYLAQLGRGFTAELTLFNEAGVGSILHLKERHQPFVAWSLESGARLKEDSTVASASPQPTAVVEQSLPAPVVQPELSKSTSGQASPPSLTRKFPLTRIVGLVCLAAIATFWLTRRKFAH